MVLEMMTYLSSVETGSDEAFLGMLKDLLHTFRDRAAGEEEFMRMAGNHLGESLDWYFAQWVEDGGIPALVWHQETAERAGRWLASLEARREQREYLPDIPVHIRVPGGRTGTHTWLIEGASGKASFEVAEKPSGVSLNEQCATLVILKRM